MPSKEEQNRKRKKKKKKKKEKERREKTAAFSHVYHIDQDCMEAFPCRDNSHNSRTNVAGLASPSQKAPAKQMESV